MPARRHGRLSAGLARAALALVAAVTVATTTAQASPASAASAEPSIASTQVVRVELIGDSVTGSPGCWRAPVWTALTDDGFHVDMVGVRTENECGDIRNAAGEPWDPDNTGIGGVTTTRMWVKLARDGVLDETRPDVIVQLLGTNDLLGGASADEILAQYDKLVELYRETNPSITVVVGTPTPIDTGACGCDAAQAQLAAALPAWAQAASTPQSPVTVADLSTGFDPEMDTVDGIHPNATGDAKLAASWTPAIAAAIAAHESAQSPAPEDHGDADAAPPPAPTAPWVIRGLALLVVGAGVVLALRRRS